MGGSLRSSCTCRCVAARKHLHPSSHPASLRLSALVLLASQTGSPVCLPFSALPQPSFRSLLLYARPHSSLCPACIHVQERIRAKLGKSAPPPPLAAATESSGAAVGEESPLPDDPDTLAAQLSETEAEVDR